MSATSPRAFLLSTTLHVGIAGLILLLSYAVHRREEPPQVFELVAGEGDNYLAQEAPALGSEGAVKIDIPEPPPTPLIEPEPAPVVPAPPTPPPVAPADPKPAPKAPDPAKDMAKSIRWQMIVADSKAKLEIKRARAAEAKRLAQEKKLAEKKEAERKEAEKKRLTKEEFDRMNAAKKSAPTKTPTPKVAKLDAEGIAKGVLGGSTKNREGGAGGKSLTASQARVLDAYFEMLKQRVRAQLVGLAGLDDSLSVTVVVNISASGVLSRARVKQSSGNDEFDRAVVGAFSRVDMPPHPEKKSEDLEMIFRTRDIEQG